MIPRYLKTVFFLFLLCTSLGVHGQKTIQPFEDYKKCLVGFIMFETGDTLYPAKFENLLSLNLREDGRNWPPKQYHIVSDHQKFGCLDPYGNWFLECIYEDLSFDWQAQQIIAKKNGKVGTISSFGETILPFEYDTIFSWQNGVVTDSVMYVVKDRKWGMVKTNNQPLIPVEYDYIEVNEFRLPDSRSKRQVIAAHRKGMIYLFDTQGKLLSELNFLTIRSFYHEQTGNKNLLFTVIDAKKRCTIVDENGKQRVPLSPSSYEAVFTIRNHFENSKPRYAKTFFKNSKACQIASLNSGLSSEVYHHMNFVGDWIYAESNKKWYVLDTNFNVVTEHDISDCQLYYFGRQGEPEEASKFPVDKYDFQYYNQIIMPFGANKVPNIYLIDRTIDITPNTRPHLPSMDFLKGIVDLNTGKESPVIYRYIIKVGGGGASYYWAVQTEDDSFNGKPEISVDVYDNSASLVNTVCLTQAELQSIFGHSSSGNPVISPLLIITEADGRDQKMNTIRWMDGSQPKVHAFERKIEKHWLTKDSTGYIACMNSSGEYLLTNIDGTPNSLENRSYKRIVDLFDWNSFSTVFELRQKSFSTLVNNRFEVLLDSATNVVMCMQDEAKLKKSVNIFAEQNGILYGYHDHAFHVLDSTYFYAPEEFNWIRKYYCVDKFGKAYSKEFMDSLVQNTPRRIGDFDVTLYKYTLKLKRHGTNEVLLFKGIDKFESRNREIEVVSTSGKVGRLNSETGEWIIPMIYREIRFCSQNAKDIVLFGCEVKGAQREWYVIDAKGKKLSEIPFDEPFMYYEKPGFRIARSKGKYGVLNEKFQWSTPPTFIAAKENILYNEKDYAFCNPETGKVFSFPHNSVDMSHKEAFIFYSHDSITLTDRNGKILVPTRPRKEFLETVNLYKFIHPLQRELTEDLEKLYSMKLGNPVLVRLNEILLMQHENGLKTTSQIMALRQSSEPNRNDRNTECVISIRYYNPSVLVEMVSGPCAERYDGYCSNGDHYYCYRLFRTVNDSLVEIKTFEDLFRENVDYETRINEALEKEVQRQQAIGLACADIKAFIANLKLHFYIKKGAIVFYDCDYFEMFDFSVKGLEDLFLPGLFE